MGCRFFYASITTRLGAEMRQKVTVKSKISNKNIRLLKVHRADIRYLAVVANYSVIVTLLRFLGVSTLSPFASPVLRAKRLTATP